MSDSRAPLSAPVAGNEWAYLKDRLDVPCGSDLTDADVRRVCAAVREVCRGGRS
jgi:hypothetical protein